MSDAGTNARPMRRYRFGVFEVDAEAGELRRKGMRVKLHAQPFQVLVLLLERPGALLTREEICRELWPDGTFVDYEHGVNSAVNRLREALGDRAANPQFVETLARRGYRFVGSVERISARDETFVIPAAATEPGLSTDPPAAVAATVGLASSGFGSLLATEQDLPKSSHAVVRTLFLLLQGMYLAFYVGALANLAEIGDLLSPVSFANEAFAVLIVTAAMLIPVRIFLICAVIFRAPGARGKFLRLWWALLPMDVLWALSPFMLLHHISYGLALACMAPLVYAPFAQRSLVLMGAAEAAQ